MCYESVASGSEIYIDTAGAKATDNSSGPLCTCSGSISGANVIDFKIEGKTSVCGSSLSFHVKNENIDIKSSPTNCLLTEQNSTKVSKTVNFNVDLEKETPPYEVDFCATLAISKLIHVVAFYSRSVLHFLKLLIF